MPKRKSEREKSHSRSNSLTDGAGLRSMPPREFSLEASSGHDYNVLENSDSAADHPYHVLEGSAANTDHPYHVLEGSNPAGDHPYHVLEGASPGTNHPYHTLEGATPVGGHPYHTLESNSGAGGIQDMPGYSQPQNALTNPMEATGSAFNLLDQTTVGHAQASHSGTTEVPSIIVENPDHELIEMVVPEEEGGVTFPQTPFFGWFQGDGPQNHDMSMINALDPTEQFQPLDPSTMEPDEVFDQPVDTRRQIRRSKPVSGTKPDVKRRS